MHFSPLTVGRPVIFRLFDVAVGGAFFGKSIALLRQSLEMMPDKHADQML